MPVLSTIEAKCKDCYRCLRACPVKAIRFRAGVGTSDGSPLAGRALHAEVVEERCILDGACLRVCPQGAKRVRPDVDRVKGWLESGEKVVASVAPSFAAALPEEPLKVVGAVRSLGFAVVEQTAVGAELVAEAVREECRAVSSGSCLQPVLPVITTACPVVVNLMEMVYPDTLRHASAVVSPMVAHGRALKRAYPGAKVVFIGPCVAKKDEAEREEVAGAVDAVLTFVELCDWLAGEGVSVAEAEPSEFDGYQPETAPLFPVEGGMLRTASLPSDLVSGQWLALSGMDDCREFLAGLSGEGRLPEELREVRLVEMLACRGGCVAGPVMPEDDTSPAVRRQRLLRFVEARRRGAGGGGTGDGRLLYEAAGDGARRPPRLEPADLTRIYRDRRPELKMPSEKEVREILARVGKTGPEDELDCGVCGYPSCREKAIAVYQGMAESDMCMPYMREMAESMSHLVVAASPYGMVVVSAGLRVIDANQAFRKMFDLGERADLTGRPLSDIIDDTLFRRAFEERTVIETEVSYPERDLLTQQTLFHLGKRDAVVGVFIDLTPAARQREQFERLRDETVERAREVIAKQMSVAQEIAGLLGETSAETKVILTKLIDLMREGEVGALDRPSGRPGQGAGRDRAGGAGSGAGAEAPGGTRSGL